MNKKLLILICIGLLQANILMSQTAGNNLPCQEANLKLTSAQETVLKDFLNECLGNGGYFVNDKGVILLTVYTDSQSIGDSKAITRWDISYSIDDWFMSNPPSKYFDYKGDLVLVWEHSNDKISGPDRSDISALKQCIWDKIGDRLYQQPPNRYRWSSRRTPDGRSLEGMRRAKHGGGGYHIIFYKDGTYVKTPMA